MSNVHTAQSVEQLSADTRETLRSRDNIATATGIVMSRRSLDRQSAHRHLMHLAQQSRHSTRSRLRPMTTRLSQRFHEALDASELTVGQLWVRYFALGGDAGEIEVDAYLNGAMAPPGIQHDMLAHAINERLDELTPPRAPYSEEYVATEERRSERWFEDD